MRCLTLLLLPLALTQCVDPYGNPMSPFGPQMPPPYTQGREQYRTDMREQDRAQIQQAYDRGLQDGRSDASAGLPSRISSRAGQGDSSVSRAYRDGYDQGYRYLSTTPPGSGATPGYPGGSYLPPTPPSQSPDSNDPSYSQGYEYGLRDRVAGRESDAGAYVGRYDPRYRRSFERGYYDAFEAQR